MSIKAHIDNWISKADPDYYVMFIKAWIPLNAWYFSEYATTKDSVALEKIKNTKNKVRNRIQALLDNEKDLDSRDFRFRLAQLHEELEKRSITNYGKKISFKSVVIDGVIPAPATDTDKRGTIYKAIPNKNTGYRAVIIDKSSKTLMDKTFNPYDFKAFLTDNQYITLDAKNKEKIKKCFQLIDPNKGTDFISTSRVKSDYIELDAHAKIRFNNDTELIAKGLVQILYELRCLLFHGLLDPTQINQPIYEHAFFILKHIIKELK
ncbi:hypothetical protein LX99_02069 [Mucilaginibacter oryzae]|uniref:Uncharacterized protein n=1 Tax=Mucilaginibacter oryzae TaxID=468058 RepID=A0A316HAJ1_9SPHI|nr:hypothetical protein [Mucilaginibacter oryzae]PWK78229.1 hypothetical protein LX99_02069 [Mucilaginibacter oryzae]